MKYILFILKFSTILSFAARSQEGYYIKEEEEEEEFKRSLIKNRVSKFEFENGKLSPDSTLSSVYEYDSLGNYTHIIWFRPGEKNETSWEVYYEYDDQENIIGANEVSSKTKYVYINDYDSNKNLIKTTLFDSNGKVQGFSVYRYDKHSNRIMKNWLSPDSIVKWSVKFFYDNSNRLVRKEIYELDELIEIGTISYNKKGQKKFFRQLDPNTKKPVVKMSWKYKKLQMVKEIVHGSYSIDYSYLKNGLVYETRWMYFKEGSPSLTRTYYRTTPL